MFGKVEEKTAQKTDKQIDFQAKVVEVRSGFPLAGFEGVLRSFCLLLDPETYRYNLCGLFLW